VPAHDEALIISRTLQTILPQLAPGDRLVVVADNCTDETAALAAAEGADVLVRTDLVRRGKGYALDYGIRHLESDAPEIVLVVDADCRITPGAIERLARLSHRSGRPVQALYLMQAAEGAGPKMRVAEFAWVIKNQVRPLGLHRLGLPCQLMGTGMAFPWACISSANLATGHIVEDLKLGIELTRRGTPPLFCPEALVTSEFPSSGEGIRSQRTRWEHGHLGVILSDAPQLFLSSLAPLNLPALALALDLDCRERLFSACSGQRHRRITGACGPAVLAGLCAPHHFAGRSCPRDTACIPENSALFEILGCTASQMDSVEARSGRTLRPARA
jgi:cellulose synthase/poly-beta-1,6-N-acetylglucosamine synthase-like glycosyltransferase